MDELSLDSVSSNSLTMMIMRSLLLLCLCCCCIRTVHSQQQLGVAIGNGNNPGGVDQVIRREHYEYNAPGAHGHHRRQAGPFDCIIPGMLLTFASSALQWWNEGRAVRDARMLADAKKQVVELDSNTPINSENEGSLVHITGHVTTNDGLADPDHGLHRPNALQLTRTTEAYQWKEQRSESRTRVSERETRVNVEYHYHKTWTTKPIESNRFEAPTGHFNPYPKYRLGKDKITAHDVRLSNGLYLEPSLVDQIGNHDFILSLSTTSKYQGHGSSSVMLGRGEGLPYNDDAVVVSSNSALYFSESRSPAALLALDSGRISSSSQLVDDSTKKKNRIAVVRSMPRPEVGDVRVSWKEVTAPADGVSILAQQQGDKLVPWKHGGSRGGHEIYNLFPGKFSAQSMLEEFIGKNKFITKILRFGGWLGSFIGLNLILSCIPALVKLLPFGVGTILQPLALIATSTIAMGVSVGLSAAVVAVAWIRFRPLLATGLAFVSGAGFLGPFFYARAKRSPEVREMDAQLHADEQFAL